MPTRIPLLRGPGGRRLRLCVRKPDYFMRYRVEGIFMGPDWRQVQASELDELLDYNLDRLNRLNNFLGEFKGKTVLIIGAGPQSKRLTTKMVKHLSEKEDVIIFGVNGMPAYCRDVWGLNPGEVFDHVVGADAVHPFVWDKWGWDDCEGARIWRKGRMMSEASLPVVSSHSPSLAADLIYYIDSVTCCISLAVLGLTTKFRTKKCWGPTKEWDQNFLVEAKDGRIILIGVEHNRRDHCYTGDPRFLLDDRPYEDWGDMEPRKDAHKRLSSFAMEVGTNIYNSASWSLIDAHPSVDFEEFLGIPDKLRNNVTKDGQPNHVVSCYKNPVAAAKYFAAMADSLPTGELPELKDKFKEDSDVIRRTTEDANL